MNISCIRTFMSAVYSEEKEKRCSHNGSHAGYEQEKWNTIPGLCYLDSNGQYRDNGIARVLKFSDLIPPEKPLL